MSDVDPAHYAVRVYERRAGQLLRGAWLPAEDLAAATQKGLEAAQLFGGAIVFYTLLGPSGAGVMTTALSTFGVVPLTIEVP